MFRSLLLMSIGVAALAQSAAAQSMGDVELLGRVHGTRPPQSYFDLKRRDPEAFQFERGWSRRNPTLRELGASGAAGGDAGVIGAPAAVLGPREGPVEGTFLFPLVMGLFADSPQNPPFPVSSVQREFFDGPNSYYKTIPEFYAEMSGGRAQLLGRTHGWARSTLTRAEVTKDQSALPGRIGEYIVQLLASVDDGSVDWGVYDNDGPDGVPNSGDDDGFVDVLAVMHPTAGAECNGAKDKIWSHKWTLQAALGQGQSFRTSSPAANGGNIRINDYTVQPVYACGEGRINEIGVFAHELGHAFGLPDLYCTSESCGHTGIGRWGLMGSGAWGCQLPSHPDGSNRPERPCHMSAWEKAALGWVEVETLAAGLDVGTLTLPPVVTSGKVYRVDAGDGSGDYFLLENRQRLGFDELIPAEGLLAWRIDTEQLNNRWRFNAVNNDASRLGIFLLQADGKNDLALRRCGGSTCGDAGDPFPGSTGNSVLHAGSLPSTQSHAGKASGLTLLGIALVGDDVRFRALTRFQNILVRTAGGGTSGGLLTVDGQSVSGTQTQVRAAPFQPVQLTAAPGAPVALGVRLGFERWHDDPAAPRSRTFVTGLDDVELVAEYGDRRELRLNVVLEGGQFGVAPGSIASDPVSADLWFTEGEVVRLTATPTKGFGFVGWDGALAGMSNPAVITMDRPMDAAARFQLTYGVPAGVRHTVEAGAQQEIVLLAENGTDPVTWTLVSGALPEGLDMSSTGRIYGAPMQTGSFPLTLRATDAAGLEATATVTLEVAAPAVGVDALVAPFLGEAQQLTELQRRFLDRSGNRNGSYDLGDLRVFFLANPNLPMTTEQRAMVRVLIPTVTFTPGQGSGGGDR